MATVVNFPQTNLQDLVEHILSSRKITRLDQQSFMAAVLSKALLNGEEQALVDRVFDALRRGLLRVVD